MKLRDLSQIFFVVAAVLGFVAMNSAWAQQPLVLNHATVYVSPDASPLKDAVVVLRGDKIVDVGNARSVKVPRKGQIIDCSGMTITAGFQNSHVHFLEAKWLHADQTPGNVLATQLADMLTSYGFTTVVDTGSDLAKTTQIRKRIESGEVPGPRIYTAGPPLFEHDAIPFYFQSFPEEILRVFIS